MAHGDVEGKPWCSMSAYWDKHRDRAQQGCGIPILGRCTAWICHGAACSISCLEEGLEQRSLSWGHAEAVSLSQQHSAPLQHLDQASQICWSALVLRRRILGFGGAGEAEAE